MQAQSQRCGLVQQPQMPMLQARGTHLLFIMQLSGQQMFATTRNLTMTPFRGSHSKDPAQCQLMTHKQART